MAQACPINFKTVDNSVSRLCSLLAAAVVALYLLTANPLWLYFLAGDLLTRLYGNQRYSLLFLTALRLKALTRLSTQHVDGAAKSVAGHFGLLFVLLLIAAAHLRLGIAVDVIAGIYMLCLLMDLFLNFCVGCKVYYLYRLICGAMR